MQQLRAVAPRRRALNRVLSRPVLFGVLALGLFGAAATPAQSPQYVVTSTGQIAVSPSMTPSWSKDAVEDLIAAIEDSAKEGLNPADYSPATLKQLVAADTFDQVAVDAQATRIARQLSRDYFLGRVADKSTMDWYIERSAYDTLGLDAALAKAVQDDKVRSWLKTLLPDNPQYAEMRDRLASTSDGAERDRLRANMERWRWMPRHLGESYVYVNVPSYQLQVVDDGTTAATYDVVVGKKATPTPQLAANASSVVVNPWWSLPASIVKEKGLSAGRRGGFVYTGNGFRQAPGPNNALGRVKIDMPNEHAIYLHDTPAKAKFAEASRGFSHGCIRVKGIDALAEQLMQMSAGDDSAVTEALGTTRTATLKMPQSLPVYIVYFTTEVDASGRLVNHEDPYGRDAQVLAALGGAAAPTQLAMK